MSKELPQPDINHELLENIYAGAMQDIYNCALINSLDFAMTGEETLVDDFAIMLFNALHYTPEHGEHVTSTWTNLQLHICGRCRHAKTNISICN